MSCRHRWGVAQGICSGADRRCATERRFLVCASRGSHVLKRCERCGSLRVFCSGPVRRRTPRGHSAERLFELAAVAVVEAYVNRVGALFLAAADDEGRSGVASLDCEDADERRARALEFCTHDCAPTDTACMAICVSSSSEVEDEMGDAMEQWGGDVSPLTLATVAARSALVRRVAEFRGAT